jgi:hypothetical protein
LGDPASVAQLGALAVRLRRAMTVIVDPDFLNHWRTRMLVDALNDEMAPLYVIRIWGHCQQRRADKFDGMPAAGLKALCKAAGDAQALETALIDAGFIARDGAAIVVPKWAEHNASLLAAWENGNKGGRPRKPTQNPRVSDGNQGDQSDNPNETHGKPTDNPSLTQTKPIRVEKSREEKSNPLFEKFYAAYPRHVGREAAEKAFEKRCPDEAMVSVMVEAIAKQGLAAKCAAGESKFVPHPATWLNEGRWKDDDGAALWTGSREVAL